jgi:hypothetical protein
MKISRSASADLPQVVSSCQRGKNRDQDERQNQELQERNENLPKPFDRMRAGGE